MAAFAWFILGYSPGRLLLSRQATPRENILFYFAQQTGEPALCDQISWRAYMRYSMIFSRGRGSYLRSDCYESSAAARQQPSICWKVRPLIDFEWISPGYSALSCRRRTLQREYSGTGLGDAVFVRTFERMGYDIDHMPSDAIFPPAIIPRDVYWSLENSPTAVTRAERILTVPTTNGPNLTTDPDDRIFLADFAAVATSDPKWCDYIPADFGLSPEHPALRDRCIYSIANNTHNSQICSRMAPSAQDPRVIAYERQGMRPDIAEQLTLHAECDRTTHNTTNSMHLHYSAEVPTDSRQTRRLIILLNDAMPSAHAWTDNQKATYFHNVLYALWPKQRDATHNVVRNELVRRLLSLPKDAS